MGENKYLGRHMRCNQNRGHAKLIVSNLSSFLLTFEKRFLFGESLEGASSDFFCDEFLLELQSVRVV